MLGLTSPFADLAELWLADLEHRETSEGTKTNYRDDVRVDVQPFFDHYTLGETTTGRVETFLNAERAVSYSRAKHSRTMLNQLFGFALRHDAIARNPVEGTSPLRRPKGSPEALTLDQIQRIRRVAAAWRTGPGVNGPSPDGNVRDVLGGTAGHRPATGGRRSRCDARASPTGVREWSLVSVGPSCTARAVGTMGFSRRLRQPRFRQAG